MLTTTNIIILINLVIFAIYTFLIGMVESTMPSQEIVEAQVMVFGAFVTSGVSQGMYWLLVTSSFLHFGIFHLFLNMLALFDIGKIIEREFSHKLVLVIFTFGSTLGSLVTFLLSISQSSNIMSVGASGGIFALIGFLFYKIFILKETLDGISSRSIINALLLALVISFLPQVNWAAHLGGFVFGILVSMLYGNIYTSMSLRDRVLNFAYVLSIVLIIISFAVLILNLFTDFVGFSINVI